MKGKVRIKGTDIVATIMQKGTHGLYMVSSEQLEGFDRTIYSPEELEEIKEDSNS